MKVAKSRFLSPFFLYWSNGGHLDARPFYIFHEAIFNIKH